MSWVMRDKIMSKKVLIIGPSGSGKTYISAELRKLGINAVDADLVDGLSDWFDKNGNKVQYPVDADQEFLDNHKFLWDKEFLTKILDKQKEIYLFGLCGNIFDMIDLFDRVYFLKVEPQVLAKNLRHISRENPMGRTDYQLENALRYVEEIERKAKELGIRIIDATNKSPEQVFSKITDG
jgi:adenylate kinase family enzyme